MARQKALRLKTVASMLGLPMEGDGELLLNGISTLDSAGPDELSFLSNPKYRKLLKDSNAGALIVHPSVAEDVRGACIIADDPYLAFARASALFDPFERPRDGIHPTAVVAAEAVHATASIGANAVIEVGAVIEEGCVIGPGCVVGAGSTIGAHSLLHANVTVYHGVSIGRACVIHSGTVIGADGFGFAPSAEGWQKIHQLGGVSIGDNVEIGANSCIDRGALKDTRIGSGVILDDMTMVGHNVEIGDGTAMAAGCQIAGSAKIGKNCTLAGNVGVVGHITIADGVHLTARSLVSKSLDAAASYSSGGTPLMETRQWRKTTARLPKLDELYRRVQTLEKMIRTIQEDSN
ncbi:UDP-3-O-(3-hydroxymyristoyl)glucosamine N-acyltransferase [Spongiibacter sp. KMU-166]|uniref:UDP-3-O-acylglucosamine N-acyltransferase n=1 Tax=Spongiibacter thalassae TaxID=2721624 RepID=A0ABX1GEL9_9GAMM|nr:UDP-3-O-(3-hydroxymyristoyl)glucosamine N-acyltransferase [Spongiibacter thalassae]NKI17601.1 UDP-3-O-(3-hydroxymyristoyl)glucosamine N-acyltransferase [Spongiibacter thalassae]